MKDHLDKAVSLGIGLAATGKEQVEKLVDEFVKKGEAGKSESSAYVEKLVEKGNETRKQLESTVREKIQSIVHNPSDREKPEHLEQRLEALERRESTDS
ncbi:phasin family protein [Paenibacillus gorillae]|uniref:phasin family protein n=1 Tax=Paenibacillus gorillae TaxID=1243662 RepID=UPI0004BAA70E|nr:ATP synthase subunit B [Paenibacillus gorillae]